MTMTTTADVVFDCVCGHRILSDGGPTECSACGRVFAQGTELSGETKPYRATYRRTMFGAGLERLLWQLSMPARVGGVEFDYVITASAAGRGTAETMIFPSDADGNILDTNPLPGSFLGDEDHKYALDGLLSHLNHEED